jgi:hypothetical protein
VHYAAASSVPGSDTTPPTGSDCTSTNAPAIEASPQSNNKLCYPEWWAPDIATPGAPQEDLFFKYVVTAVISNPVTGGANDQSEETDYFYTGAPGWRYDNSPFVPASKRTWSIFAGLNRLETRVGSSTSPATEKTTQYAFFQGMDGDRSSSSGGTKTSYVVGSTTLKDSLQYGGMSRETKVLNGVGGATVSDTVSTPESTATTPTTTSPIAYSINESEDLLTEPIAAGGSRSTDTTYAYDSYGNVTQQQVATSDAGTICTLTQYATPNTAAWIIGLASHVARFSTTCGAATTGDPAPAISESRTSYDSGTPGSMPTLGATTKEEVVVSYGATESTAHWDPTAKATMTYDCLGQAENAH